MINEIDSLEASQIEQFLGENWAAFLAFITDCGQSEAAAESLMEKLQAKVNSAKPTADPAAIAVALRAFGVDC